MTVEVKAEATQMAEESGVVSEQVQPLKVVEGGEKEATGVKDAKDDEESKPKAVEKSSSYREESNFSSDLKENERKALNELKSKLEEAILTNTLFNKEQAKEAAKESPKKAEDDVDEKVEKAKESEEEKKNDDEEEEEEKVGAEKCNDDVAEAVDEDISIWGVPLLPSKGDEATNVVLLKFLRAREFKVNDAFEMLKKTLQWRKDLKIDSVLDEDLGADLAPAAYMSGIDHEGHPICYNIFGALDDEDLYKKTFGTEEKRVQFLRWRVQLMEKGIQKLDFKPGGVSSLLQINDLKNSPGPTKKEVRVATKQAVALLQDNYPEFVAKNIFINVPFWYYAFQSLLSPFLTARTKSKFVFARPAKVTETLLKYIPINEIPVQYGGMKRENDFEFSADDGEVSEVLIKPGSTEIIEIPALEVGKTTMWDVMVLNWDVNYKEEFVPADESSYTVVIQKEKKISSNEGPIRNTFKNQEAGKIVLSIHNCSSKKKKAFYRQKIQKTCS